MTKSCGAASIDASSLFASSPQTPPPVGVVAPDIPSMLASSKRLLARGGFDVLDLGFEGGDAVLCLSLALRGLYSPGEVEPCDPFVGARGELVNPRQNLCLIVGGFFADLLRLVLDDL
jgi:hypothetical protein